MLKKTLKKNISFYEERLKKHGFSAQSVGWNSSVGHQKRLRMLTSFIKKKSITINDYGCGYGELLIFLKKKNYTINCYHGYDISKKMINKAKLFLKKFQNKIFYNSKEIESRADYTIICGTFNNKFNTTYTSWKRHIKKILENVYKNSNIAFAFNGLTNKVDWRDNNLFYSNPEYWKKYIKNTFDCEATILENYDLWEWTIIVKK